MPILFEDVCNLLDALESLEIKQPPLLPGDKADRLQTTTQTWFNRRRPVLDRLGTDGLIALLSTLLPERRPDRVYGLQAATLSRVLSRGLSLGNALSTALQAYKLPGRGDLGECLQRVVDRSGPPALPKVEMQEVDGLMTWLASQCRFSSAALQARATSSTGTRDDKIGYILKRLSGRDAKWFARLILKDFSPVTLSEGLVLKSTHFLLPHLLRFQDDISAAVNALRTTFDAYPSAPDTASERLLAINASSTLKPKIGVKVGRPYFTKARSIQHCLNMLAQQSWVIERKYDGEFCEIHIDLSLSFDPAQCIKIFAKSGKDATRDRQGIIPTLVSSLRLGQADCSIKKEAILHGELVVWSDLTGNVLPFEEIRKHVTRSGSFIGTRQDSRPTAGEHLCIVFFDVLLLDDKLLLKDSVEQRRQMLRAVYTKQQGRAKSAEWKVIDFGLGNISKQRLMEQFAASNAMACEGLVLKPCGQPYFSLVFNDDYNGFIKLKKDYIAGLGDEADFAVVGGSYSAQHASTLGVRWTHFHLGAMLNKDQVLRFQHRPLYRLVATIGPDMCIPRPVLEAANRLGISLTADANSDKDSWSFDIEPGSSIKVGTVFLTPMIFEVLGSGYVKPSDCNFYMLRHPRVKKLHQDRSWKDCVGFAELQDLVVKARTTGVESESQENRHELARLERSMKRKFDRLSKTPSPKKVAQTPQDTSSAASTRSALAEISSNTRASPRRPSLRQANAMSPQKRRRLEHQSTVKTAPQRYSIIQTPGVRYSDIYNEQALASRAAQLRRQCVDKDCALSKAVVCFSACIASTPYVTSDLAGGHAVTKVSSWRHWLRECTTFSDSSVGESQAYPGLRRIIIAEGRRANAVASLVRDMLCNEGFGRVDIEIWDWRMLEVMQSHESSLDNHTALLLGRLTWDSQLEKMTYETTRRH